MTVIVAARTRNGVVMAADSRTMAGWHISTKATPKLWVDGKWAIGGAGRVRAIQCIRYHVTLPKYRPDEHTDFERFAVTEIVPAIRAAVKDRGIVKTDSGDEDHQASTLLAIGDRIVEICSDGTVHIEPEGRQAIGSGYAEALGYLGERGPWTVAQVVEAVRRASLTNGGVAGPISAVDTTTLNVEVVD